MVPASFNTDNTDRRCNTARNQRESPLLRLPDEIRNMIYRLLFEEATLVLTETKDAL
jgi:hypothetical protein